MSTKPDPNFDYHDVGRFAAKHDVPFTAALEIMSEASAIAEKTGLTFERTLAHVESRPCTIEEARASRIGGKGLGALLNRREPGDDSDVVATRRAALLIMRAPKIPPELAALAAPTTPTASPPPSSAASTNNSASHGGEALAARIGVITTTNRPQHDDDE